MVSKLLRESIVYSSQFKEIRTENNFGNSEVSGDFGEGCFSEISRA